MTPLLISHGEIMGCVYKVTSPSGKAYVGITSGDFKTRWKNHLAYAKRKNGYLQNAINKYGPKSFLHEILFESDDYQALKDKEVEYIVSHKTKYPHGYNMTDGGDGVLGVVITEECRKNKRAAQQKIFQNPDRMELQRRTLAQNKQSPKLLEYLKSDEKKEANRTNMLERWADEEKRNDMLKNRKKGPRILDGLTNVQRARLKDVEAYRKRKREWAKTPAEKEKRRLYMIEWRNKNREEYNRKCRERKKHRQEKQILAAWSAAL
jgi:group I intron endonuclease